MICISYHPRLWLVIIYLYFMILHVGKDTTHLQYCATASWHWQMTNPPVTSLQKIMYTKCTFACKDRSTNQKQSLEIISLFQGYPTLWEMDSSWMVYPIRSSRVVRWIARWCHRDADPLASNSRPMGQTCIPFHKLGCECVLSMKSPKVLPRTKMSKRKWFSKHYFSRNISVSVEYMLYDLNMSSILGYVVNSGHTFTNTLFSSHEQLGYS